MSSPSGFTPHSTPSLSSERLALTPLRADDATEMVAVLSSAPLYEFIGGIAPTEDELRQRYEAQVAGSPEPNERWHNWIVRKAGSGSAVGYVQATLTGHRADIAWVIGRAWQGMGYATEAAGAVLAWMTGDGGVEEIEAAIHPDHRASRRVAASLGLEPTSRIVDGEQVWRWRRPR